MTGSRWFDKFLVLRDGVTWDVKNLSNRDLSNHLEPDIWSLDNVWAVQPNDVNRKDFCVNGS